MPRITAARANEQRGRILDAALTCFAREGFHAATVQDIVEESGLSPGAIYGYFKGKTEIAMAIASERHAMERRRMEFALAAPDIDTSLQRLVEGFVLELRNPEERRWRHLAVQLWAESLSNPRLKREALGGGFPGRGRVGADDRAGATTGALAAASRSTLGRPCHGRGPAGHFAAACLGRARRYRALRRRAADHARSAFGRIGCGDRLSRN